MNTVFDRVPDPMAAPEPLAAPARTGRLVACVMLGALYFVPAALPFLFDASSFAVGTVSSLLFFWFLHGMGWTPRRSIQSSNIAWLWALGVAAFVMLHLIVASQFGSVDFGRALSSLAILMFMIVSAALIADTLFVIDDRTLWQTMTLLGFVFLAIAILSVVGIQPPTQSVGEKPIFPYTEPSFFAIAFAPVLIYLCASSPLWMRLSWLTLGLAMALALANLTLMVSVVLAAAVSLPPVILAGVVFSLASFSSMVDLSYFTDRINFALTTTNLSTLVYIQGWQLLDESLRNTWGWGLGFQQLGVGYTNVPASIRLKQLLGFDLNLADGSFIFAKIGSEFGVFGLIFSSIILYFSATSFIKVRLAINKRSRISAPLMLSYSIIIAGSIEILVRGANYFTGSIVMIISSLFFLIKTNKRNSDIDHNRV